MRRLALILLGSLCSASVAAANFDFQFVDAENTFAQRGWMDSSSLFQRNFRAAGVLLGAAIASDQTIKVEVRADANTARFGGGLNFGLDRGLQQGLHVLEPGALTRVLGGVRTNTPDIVVTVNAAFSDQWYWPDTQPETRSGVVPQGKTDLISIVMHELVHGLGVSARRSFDTATLGQYYDNVRIPYDLLTRFAGNGQPSENGIYNQLEFFGPETVLTNGGPLKLTYLPPGSREFSQNFSHIGDCSDALPYRTTLMNGCSVPVDGSRLKLTPYDLGLIADMGYPVRSVFFADSGILSTAVRLDGVMYGARLQRVDTQGYEFDLIGTSLSNRAESEASFDSTSGTLTMNNLTINDSPQRYSVMMKLVPNVSNLRFSLHSATLLP
ncbi:hypothetical protein [Chitinimonas sp. JJ19]|uniref:hypothetical protein n=1 Tax=Chitinimonas sp. JJ19 TaxID=3109352 RepID=UPI0030015AFC